MALCAGRHCFKEDGIYVINIKIYVDEASEALITEHMVKMGRNDPHRDKKMEKARELYYENRLVQEHLPYVQQYFGLIFDLFNARLVKTGLQIKADYNDMLAPRFQHLKEKYCAFLSNINTITEAFLAETDDMYNEGVNRILIVHCDGNDPYLQKRYHIATRNGCGHVMGALLTTPREVQHTVDEMLTELFYNKTGFNMIRPDKNLQNSVCSVAGHCRYKHNDFGSFIEGIESIGKVADLEAIQAYQDDLIVDGYSKSLINLKDPELKSKAHTESTVLP